MKRATHYLIAICVCVPVSFGAFDHVISDTYEHGTVTLNSESLLVTGAGALSIRAYGSSYVELRETTPPLQMDVGGVWGMRLNDSSSMNYYGGETGDITFWDNSSAVIQGGRIDYISSYQYVLSSNQTYIPHIEIVSTEYDFDSSTNKLTGVWMDDSTFDIQLVDQSGYDPVIENIFFTPEPATLCMMGVGVLLLRRRSERRRHLQSG